jgi:hypothetical protein
MGVVPKPETKRDNKLIRDYLEKTEDGRWVYSIAQLGIKYARIEDGEIYPLTASRIHQILDKHGVPKNRYKRT